MWRAGFIQVIANSFLLFLLFAFYAHQSKNQKMEMPRSVVYGGHFIRSNKWDLAYLSAYIPHLPLNVFFGLFRRNWCSRWCNWQGRSKSHAGCIESHELYNNNNHLNILKVECLFLENDRGLRSFLCVENMPEKVSNGNFCLFE